MISRKSQTVFARVFAGLTLALGCIWLLGLVKSFQWAMGVQIGLMSFLFGTHLIAAWVGARSSIRGSVAMFGANALSLISPTYLNVPVAPGPTLKVVLFAVVAGLVAFVLLQILTVEQRRSST